MKTLEFIEEILNEVFYQFKSLQKIGYTYLRDENLHFFIIPAEIKSTSEFKEIYSRNIKRAWQLNIEGSILFTDNKKKYHIQDDDVIDRYNPYNNDASIQFALLGLKNIVIDTQTKKSNASSQEAEHGYDEMHYFSNDPNYPIAA